MKSKMTDVKGPKYLKVKDHSNYPGTDKKSQSKDKSSLGHNAADKVPSLDKTNPYKGHL